MSVCCRVPFEGRLLAEDDVMTADDKMMHSTEPFEYIPEQKKKCDYVAFLCYLPSVKSAAKLAAA